MPSVRSLILLTVMIAIVSLIGATLSLLRPPDSGGRRRDTFGVERGGFRGLHDVLTELGIPVRRQIAPPGGDRPESSEPASRGPRETFVLLQPDLDLTGTEPAYLQRLLPWVESGGRLVVATGRLEPERTSFQAAMRGGTHRPTIFETLGLPDALLIRRPSVSGSAPPRESDDNKDNPFRTVFREAWNRESPTFAPLQVQAEGTLSRERAGLLETWLPAGDVGTLDLRNPTAGRLLMRLPEQKKDSVLAAEIPRGEGSIVLLAEPSLLENQVLARGDNAVLAARLLAPEGQTVIFDEFYHGLSVRGNALYLLTRPGYLALVLGLLLTTGLVVWREAIFLGPPLADPVRERRDLAEYLSAMGRFFSVGRGTGRFLVQELRDGVLRELSRELSLPPEKQDAELVSEILARHQPARSQRVRQVFRDVDDRLASGSRGRWSQAQTVEVMRRLTGCLSKNA